MQSGYVRHLSAVQSTRARSVGDNGHDTRVNGVVGARVDNRLQVGAPTRSEYNETRARCRRHFTDLISPTSFHRPHLTDLISVDLSG